MAVDIPSAPDHASAPHDGSAETEGSAKPDGSAESDGSAPLGAAAPTGAPAVGGAARRPRARRRLVGGAALVALVAGASALAAGASGGDPATAPAVAASHRAATDADGVVSTETAIEEAGAVAKREPGQVDPLAPLPKARPKVVAPVAGRLTEDAGEGEPARSDDAGRRKALPEPTGPASAGANGDAGTGGVHDLEVNTATALPNGVALPPLEAPEAVLQVIRAGNTIARTPYKWGGGHGSFKDNGYDCSGSVTFALYSAGLIGGSATSGQLMSYGRPGPGRWITLYANGGHVFMVVAGIRFDTVGRAVTGSRWQNEMVSTGGYVARHPPGY